MIIVHLPQDLAQDLGAEQTSALAAAATLGDLLHDLDGVYPGLLRRLTEANGNIRPHINVFVGDTMARTAGGLALPLADLDEVWIIRAVSGG